MRHGRERTTPQALPNPPILTSFYACLIRPGPILASRGGSFLASAEGMAAREQQMRRSSSQWIAYRTHRSDAPAGYVALRPVVLGRFAACARPWPSTPDAAPKRAARGRGQNGGASPCAGASTRASRYPYYCRRWGMSLTLIVAGIVASRCSRTRSTFRPSKPHRPRTMAWTHSATTAGSQQKAGGTGRTTTRTGDVRFVVALPPDSPSCSGPTLLSKRRTSRT